LAVEGSGTSKNIRLLGVTGSRGKPEKSSGASVPCKRGKGKKGARYKP